MTVTSAYYCSAAKGQGRKMKTTCESVESAISATPSIHPASQPAEDVPIIDTAKCRIGSRAFRFFSPSATFEFAAAGCWTPPYNSVGFLPRIAPPIGNGEMVEKRLKEEKKN